MPSELDPAYGEYLPPSQFSETPTQGMKRIERAMRPGPGTPDGSMSARAGQSRQGSYNAGVGVQGPLSGALMASSKPYTGEPGALIARGEAGPVSYQAVQPMVRGAPMSQTLGVGGKPFDADAYFGVNATRAPGQGTQYGAEIRSGGFGAQGQYDPATKGYSVGAGYQTNFATGGRAVVGHTTAAGEPVSLEEHKGQIRHRQDSGASRMAADYGYIDTSKPDHDGMKTDAFVGPHRDSKKVFVVNQQHPHTGKFNEHKVLLGYKDRAHALRDYAHSFSDGLGHKRIHSVVEMGTHELKDWLKKPHTEPLKKAGGGPVDEPRPLTIRRGVTPQGLAAEMVPPEEQGPIEGRQAASPSPEGVTSALQGVAEGVSSLYATPQADAAYTTAPPAPVRRPITPQMIAASLNPEAQGAASPSLEGLGQGMVSMGEDPVGLIGGMLPGIGNVMAAADVSKLKDKIAELRASGDEEGATRLQKILPLAAMGAVMPMGAGAATKAAIKGAEKGAAKAAERELSSMGLYSHAAEVADALPQAKGSPQQMKAMLKGVKQEELAGFDEAFAGQKSVTKDEIAQHFRDQMPVVEETVLGRDQLSLKERHRYYDLDDAVAKDGVNALSPEQQQEYYALQNKWNQEKPTKFGQYTLPGGENYREVLLKLPEGYGAPKQALDDLAAARQRFKDLDKRHTDELHAGLTGDMNMSYEDFDKLTRDRDIAESRVKNFEKLANQPAFQSGHWQDPNVLAHLRLADRTGPNGEKILHVEEIQSDWGQKGKKEGFADPKAAAQWAADNAAADKALYEARKQHAEVVDRIRLLGEPLEPFKRGVESPRAFERREAEHFNKRDALLSADPDYQASRQRLDAAKDAIRALGPEPSANRIPTAPYVTNTQALTDLALKRALKEAAEGGYDKLVWTPGAEQAKRYDLSRHVDNITWSAEPDGKYWVGATKDGRPVRGLENEPMDAKKLEATFGKEIAEKIVKGEGKKMVGGPEMELTGLDLQTGGEGMKGYYDKIVPNQLSKLVKKLDPEAKIGTHEIRTTKESDLRRKLRDEGYDPDQIEIQELLSDNGGRAPRGFTEADLDAIERGDHFNGVSQKGVTAPSLTITPAMRESILKGQTAFAEGGEVEAPAQGGPVAPASVIFDVHHKASKQGLNTRDLSLLIKLATGAPAEWSHGLAGHLMSGNDTFLRGHAAKYPKVAEVMRSLNSLLGGGKWSGSAKVDPELVESAMQANRKPAMQRALAALHGGL